ncbi:hypothetical protein CR513_00780, partial [Mucuna pruriens]
MSCIEAHYKPKPGKTMINLNLRNQTSFGIVLGIGFLFTLNVEKIGLNADSIMDLDWSRIETLDLNWSQTDSDMDQNIEKRGGSILLESVRLTTASTQRFTKQFVLNSALKFMIPNQPRILTTIAEDLSIAIPRIYTIATSSIGKEYGVNSWIHGWEGAGLAGTTSSGLRCFY